MGEPLPKVDGLRSGVWAAGKTGFLYAMILHELGHVFGVQHRAQENSTNAVMSSDFAETLFKPELAYVAEMDAEADFPLMYRFESLAGGESWIDAGDATRFFDVVQVSGMSIQLKEEAGSYVVFLSEEYIPIKRLGRIAIDDVREEMIFFGDTPKLWLPSEQVIFDKDNLDVPFGPTPFRRRVSGTFISESGNRRAIYLEQEAPYQTRMTGYLGGKLIIPSSF